MLTCKCIRYRKIYGSHTKKDVAIFVFVITYHNHTRVSRSLLINDKQTGGVIFSGQSTPIMFFFIFSSCHYEIQIDKNEMFLLCHTLTLFWRGTLYKQCKL